MPLAPVGLSVYTRLDHIIQTVEALSLNTLAGDTDLFIFSDAPKPGDEAKVRAVRDYLHTITGFRTVSILERVENSRVKNNRGGVQQLLDNCGKMIFMEEDIVTAPGFLEFMNQALSLYANKPDILSVSGHAPNLESFRDLEDEVFITKRFHGWGVGLWKNKYELIRRIPKWRLVRNDKATISAIRDMGDDMLHMIRNESKGRTDALDIRACYLCARKNYWNVIPTTSLVRNTGLDGTGVHCSDRDPYVGQALNQQTTFSLPRELMPRPAALEEYRGFYSQGRKRFRKLKQALNIQ